MIYIRSTLFQIAFFLTNTVLCVCLLWILVLPRKWAWVILVYTYFSAIGILEKYILGLTYTIEGKENVPDKGPFIIAMKHQSAYETFKIFHLFGDARIILKRELMWLPLWGWYAWKSGMIAVDRGKQGAMKSIIKNAKPVIEAGGRILIYPQGTRVPVGATTKDYPYKQGALRLYDHYKIPIVPVAMNAGKFWPKRSFLIKPGVVTFKVMPVIPAGLEPSDAMQRMKTVIESESDKLI